MPASIPPAQAAAAILAERRLHGQQGPCLPEPLRPQTLDEAMRIQMATIPLMGDSVAAWKCGTPGPDKVVVAPIYAGTVHEVRQGAGTADGVCPVWAHADEVRVEPELAFVFGRALPPRAQPYAPQEVDEAIASTHLALELIDSRYSDPSTLSFADKLADGLVNQGLFIGPAVDGERARLTHVMPIAIRIEGMPEQVRAGQHPDPLPRLPLYWLVNYLREQGICLQAGQAVITGSYAGTFGLPVARDITLRYGDLGAFSVRFEARVRA